MSQEQRVVSSPFHTARRTRQIAGTLPGRLLCESKHVPGLIPGLNPGRGPSNIAGFSPGTRNSFSGCFEGRSTFATKQICANCNEAEVS